VHQRHRVTLAMLRSPKVADITTLVMDLEGSDGRERGEDDTNFERQVSCGPCHDREAGWAAPRCSSG
jgi:hypothetical protein